MALRKAPFELVCRPSLLGEGCCCVRGGSWTSALLGPSLRGKAVSRAEPLEFPFLRQERSL